MTMVKTTVTNMKARVTVVKTVTKEDKDNDSSDDDRDDSQQRQ